MRGLTNTEIATVSGGMSGVEVLSCISLGAGEATVAEVASCFTGFASLVSRIAPPMAATIGVWPALGVGVLALAAIAGGVYLIRNPRAAQPSVEIQ